ncbi:Alpha beta-propellor repeat-containing integrin [Seminavis robusta]|uniref:Alpha beta-propellor repeat-containing integrin n=1 Tax=Seminavis robusta TaxID=568900 RepID=A0A9N8E646_9STRA|nr:Alpha beta-propellor repeat-containing integrin [Seminavis robusta]|eukprot:Sro712_g191350.1 Alpha beta-propellor repeat-containing integrin (1019) ;mRNA; f:20553-23609
MISVVCVLFLSLLVTADEVSLRGNNNLGAPSVLHQRNLVASAFTGVGSPLSPPRFNNIGGLGQVQFGATALLAKKTGNRLLIGSPSYDFSTASSESSTAADNTDGGALFLYELNSSEDWERIWFFHGQENEGLGSFCSINEDGSRVAFRRLYENPHPVQVVDVPSGIQVGSDVSCAGDIPGEVMALSASGSRLAITCRTRSGRVEIFEFDEGVNEWQPIGQLNGLAVGDLFGFALSWSQDATRLAVTSPNHDGTGMPNKGILQVFEYLGQSKWSQLGNTVSGKVAFDQLGFSVDLNADGSVVVVSAPGSSPGNKPLAGCLQVLDFDGTEWVEDGPVICGQAPSDRFGRSVSLAADGQRLAGSSWLHNGAKGRVAVFERLSGKWAELASLEGKANGDRMGFGRSSVSLALNGARLSAGATWTRSAAGVSIGEVVVVDLHPTTESPSSLPSTTPTYVSHTGDPTAAPSRSDDQMLELLSPSTVLILDPIQTLTPSGSPSIDLSTRTPSNHPSDGFLTSNPTGSARISSFPTSTTSKQPSWSPSNDPTGTSPPNLLPTEEPTGNPSTLPSFEPSSSPSDDPSISPSKQPSWSPSNDPTDTSPPSLLPTEEPTGNPSTLPSFEPSSSPSDDPSISPSKQPSLSPSNDPSPPSLLPTGEPTGTGNPPTLPSSQVSSSPSDDPSISPSSIPSEPPSRSPSQQPSPNPTNAPSDQPSLSALDTTGTGSVLPSSTPSNVLHTQLEMGTPSIGNPRVQPSAGPSAGPSSSPSLPPSSVPSLFPSTPQPSALVVASQSPSVEPSSRPTGSTTKETSVGLNISTVFPTVFPSAEINVEGQVEEVDEAEDAIMDYTITSCHCDDSFNCTTDAVDRLFSSFNVCVTTNETGVSIVEISQLFFFSASSNMRLDAIINGTITELTTKKLQSEDNAQKAVVQTSLISALFDDEDPSTIEVSGMCIIMVNGDSEQRLLQVPVSSRGLESNEEGTQAVAFSFEMEIEAQTPVSVATMNGLIWPWLASVVVSVFVLC